MGLFKEVMQKPKPTIDIPGLSVTKDGLESPKSSLASTPQSTGMAKLADLFDSNRLITSNILSPKGGLFFEKGKSLADYSTANKTSHASGMPDTNSVNPVGFLRQKYISEVELNPKRVISSPKGLQSKTGIAHQRKLSGGQDCKLSVVGEQSDEAKNPSLKFFTAPTTDETARLNRIRDDLRSGNYTKPQPREAIRRPSTDSASLTHQLNMTREAGSARIGMNSLTGASSVKQTEMVRKPVAAAYEIATNAQRGNRRSNSMQQRLPDSKEKASATAAVVSFTCDFIQKIITENKELIIKLEAHELRQRQLEAVIQELQFELETHRSDRAIVSNLKEKVRALRNTNTSLSSNLRSAQDRIFNLEMKLSSVAPRPSSDERFASHMEGGRTPRFDQERGSHNMLTTAASGFPAPTHSRQSSQHQPVMQPYSRCHRLKHLDRKRVHRSVPTDRMMFADHDPDETVQPTWEVPRNAIPRRALFA